MSDEPRPKVAADPRADVNQDGRVDASDLLIIRSPANWNLPTSLPPPPPTPPAEWPKRRAVAYTGQDTEQPVWDVRAPSTFLNYDLKSTGRGLVCDPYWKVNGLNLQNVTLDTHSYGLYLGASNVRLTHVGVTSQARDPIRIVGGSDYDLTDFIIGPALAPVAFRIHGDTSYVTIKNGAIYCTDPWALDLGEQYGGAGGIVEHVLLQDINVYARPGTVCGFRIRARHVTLVNCHGIGFDKTLKQDAPLVQIERHSCDPVGVKVIGCSVDGGRPIVGSRWHDTEVR